MKKDKDQELIVEQLKKIPIVEIACEKLKISRSTYYRWREDPEFAQAADAAMRDGELFINDLSEAQVVNLIREKNWPAIRFWLTTHHPAYRTRVDISAKVAMAPVKLTPEQEEEIERALKLASLIGEDDDKDSNKSNK